MVVHGIGTSAPFHICESGTKKSNAEQCIALHSLYPYLGTCQLFLDVYASDSHATVDLLDAGLSVLSVRNTLHELRMCVLHCVA